MGTIILILIGFATGWFVIHPLLRELPRLRRERDELERWRVYWQESRRWLAEFPDVAAALEHLKAKAEGAGGTDIVLTREVMRKRRDVGASIDAVRAHPAVQAASAGLTAQAAAARADEFDMRCRLHSAECCDGEPVTSRGAYGGWIGGA